MTWLKLQLCSLGNASPKALVQNIAVVIQMFESIIVCYIKKISILHLFPQKAQL